MMMLDGKLLITKFLQFHNFMAIRSIVRCRYFTQNKKKCQLYYHGQDSCNGHHDYLDYLDEIVDISVSTKALDLLTNRNIP